MMGRLLAAFLMAVAACTPIPAVQQHHDDDAAAEGEGEASAEGEGELGEGEGEASVPLAGFGAISGDCGVLDDELRAATPSVFLNAIDFGTDPYDDVDSALLTDGAREILADGNAGGSSLLSEVFAFEVLARCERATLRKTETEVEYTTSDSKITDLVIDIDGSTLGVSVTRAVGYPFEDPYTEEQAFTLLERKLRDILDASAHVAPSDAWVKQILLVVAYAPEHVASIEAALATVDASTRADTIVIVTVSNGDDAFLY